MCNVIYILLLVLYLHNYVIKTDSLVAGVAECFLELCKKIDTYVRKYEVLTVYLTRAFNSLLNFLFFNVFSADINVRNYFFIQFNDFRIVYKLNEVNEEKTVALLVQ